MTIEFDHVTHDLSHQLQAALAQGQPQESTHEIYEKLREYLAVQIEAPLQCSNEADYNAQYGQQDYLVADFDDNIESLLGQRQSLKQWYDEYGGEWASIRRRAFFNLGSSLDQKLMWQEFSRRRKPVVNPVMGEMLALGMEDSVAEEANRPEDAWREREQYRSPTWNMKLLLEGILRAKRNHEKWSLAENSGPSRL